MWVVSALKMEKVACDFVELEDSVRPCNLQAPIRIRINPFYSIRIMLAAPMIWASWCCCACALVYYSRGPCWWVRYRHTIKPFFHYMNFAVQSLYMYMCNASSLQTVMLQ
jgi:hypothetical protein